MIERYWHLYPDFFIEVRSKTGRLPTLRAKMNEWIENGVQLGWLIDAETNTVEIYRPNRQPELLSNLQSLEGDTPVVGFVLNLIPVWDRMGEG